MIVVVVGFVWLVPESAQAGMPAPFRLTDVARMRIEAISFFIAVLLASSGLIQLLWNGLRSSFGMQQSSGWTGRTPRNCCAASGFALTGA